MLYVNIPLESENLNNIYRKKIEESAMHIDRFEVARNPTELILAQLNLKIASHIGDKVLEDFGYYKTERQDTPHGKALFQAMETERARLEKIYKGPTQELHQRITEILDSGAPKIYDWKKVPIEYMD